MSYRSTGGEWEDLGRGWSRASKPALTRMKTHNYVPDPNEGIIYGPKGDVLARAVDRSMRMGFRPTEDA